MSPCRYGIKWFSICSINGNHYLSRYLYWIEKNGVTSTPSLNCYLSKLHLVAGFVTRPTVPVRAAFFGGTRSSEDSVRNGIDATADGVHDGVVEAFGLFFTDDFDSDCGFTHGVLYLVVFGASYLPEYKDSIVCIYCQYPCG